MLSFLFDIDIFIFYLEIISPKLGSDASSPFWIMSKKKIVEWRYPWSDAFTSLI